MVCEGSGKHQRPEWNCENLDKTLTLLREQNVSIRTAAVNFGIPN